MCRLVTFSSLTICTAALLGHCGESFAGETASHGVDAAGLVDAALHSEIDALPARREILLLEALKRDPEYAPARWHTGQIRRGGQWMPYELIASPAATDKGLVEYRQIRDSFANTYQGQLDLANWCRRNKLPDEERAHLTAALELSGNPNNPVLRSRLGFEWIYERWMTRDDIQEHNRKARELQEAFERWLPKLQRIARGLSRTKGKSREASISRLKAIQDPDVFPVMEVVFATRDVESARLLLDVYDNMKSSKAAEAIARQAVLSPWKSVREAAAKELKTRPPESYAPGLLDRLSTPIESKMSLYVGRSSVVTAQTFFRETQDFKQLAVVGSTTDFRTQFGRDIAKPINSTLRRTTIESVTNDRILEAYSRNRQADEQNEQTTRMNVRVGAALSTATNVDLPAEPTAWWSWWLRYNDLYQGEGYEKPFEFTYTYDEDVEIVPQYDIVPRLDTPKSCSCLSAGTPVWTDRGPVSVETVKVGDLALAKNPETGELAYKPVLRTTVRPETRLYKLNVGEHAFSATGGHNFWVSGRGWVKVRDFSPGLRLHAVNGTATLESIDEATAEPTYNLIVADFHTYFVGDAMILSHDPTFAEPTDNLVPGLSVAFDGP